jgi:hypothetical protein
MRNSLADLNNHLFAQLERLGDEELAGDKLTTEIERGRAVAGIATQIIANGTLALKAKTALHDWNGRTALTLPKFLDEP